MNLICDFNILNKKNKKINQVFKRFLEISVSTTLFV